VSTKTFVVVNCNDPEDQGPDPADRGRLIGTILSDRRCRYTPEALAGKSVEELAAICDLITGSRQVVRGQPSLNSRPDFVPAILPGQTGPARVESGKHLPCPQPYSTPSFDLADERDHAGQVHLPYPGQGGP
jgi:hypothetical protein